jgi:hypothetical protein
MMMTLRVVSQAALIAALSVLPATAQQEIKPAAPQMGPAVALKVTVVLSRYQGEKRISSMPYVMGVVAKDHKNAPKTTLRMGVDVPVVQTVFGGGGDKSIPQSSYTYRNVGTNIDCTAFLDEPSPGFFQLLLTVSDTSVGIGSASKQPGAPAVMADVPTFRSFNSSFVALLRDGQTMQYTSATDPLSGEVMKIDVSLALMK